ncbi:unnamed protein product [Dibothriocephalus latus]|uniref:Tetraspanin n=1 Tax=Dibothriocephalus latus TaxID=60516 RepID=A0A3P6SZ48_DIBLA|nr:unnamed protein product [Dibothriocephalus latus]
MYTGILGVCVVAEAIGLGYFFGDPKALPAKVTVIMEKALQDYGKPEVQLAGATFVWDYLMTSDNDYCCGLEGYTNFTGKALPKACCAKDNKLPEKCELAEAEKLKVIGCQTKIDKFLEEKKKLFLIAPIILVVVQVILVILLIV